MSIVIFFNLKRNFFILDNSNCLFHMMTCIMKVQLTHYNYNILFISNILYNFTMNHVKFINKATENQTIKRFCFLVFLQNFTDSKTLPNYIMKILKYLAIPINLICLSYSSVDYVK